MNFARTALLLAAMTALFLVVMTGTGLDVSGILFWLQATVLEAWCRFCLASAAVTALLFVTALLLVRRVGRTAPLVVPG